MKININLMAKYNTQFTKTKGFTLVELSIVLVIVGLLIGGILVGQSLIDSAKLAKSVRYLSEQSIYINLFKEKFRQLPGDYSKANQILSANYSGNGDGSINFASEIVSVYEHLYMSQIIKESYNANGAWDVKYPTYSFDENTVTYLWVQSLINANNNTVGGDYSGASDAYSADSIIVMNHPAGWTNNGAVTVKAAMYLDSKIDDGLPGKGNVRSRNSNVGTGAATGCRTNTNPARYRESEWTLTKCIPIISLNSLF